MQISKIIISGACFCLLMMLQNEVEAQPNLDTLQHYSLDQDFVSPETEGEGENWGFIFGHSNLGYNQFAEKFYFRGDGIQVEKVISYLNVRAIELSDFDSASLAVYESGGNRPGLLLREKSRAYKNLRFGHPKISDATIIDYDQPVPVEDSFYVSFELNGYSPTFFQRNDTIGLWVLSNGARPQSEAEQSVPARNAVRDVNNQGWKSVDGDLGWQTHFALAPVVSFTRASSTGESAYGENGQLRVFAPYPNPAKNQVTLKYRLKTPSDLTIKISDLNGKTRAIKSLSHKSAGQHQTSLGLSDLASGSYICSIVSDVGIVSMSLQVVD